MRPAGCVTRPVARNPRTHGQIARRARWKGANEQKRVWREQRSLGQRCVSCPLLFHAFAQLKLYVTTFWTVSKHVPPRGTSDTRTNYTIGLGHALIQHHHTGVLPSLPDSLPALPLSDSLAPRPDEHAWVRGAIPLRINSLIRGHSRRWSHC